MTYSEYTNTPDTGMQTSNYYTITAPYSFEDMKSMRIPLRERIEARQAWRQLRPFIEEAGMTWTRKPDADMKQQLVDNKYTDLKTAELVSQALYPQGKIKVPSSSGLAPLYIKTEQKRWSNTAPASIVHTIEGNSSN